MDDYNTLYRVLYLYHIVLSYALFLLGDGYTLTSVLAIGRRYADSFTFRDAMSDN